MCSVSSSTGSASRTNTGAGLELTYGSIAVRLPTARSSLRSVGSVRSGWPFTQKVGAESLCTTNDGEPAGSFGLMFRLTSPIWLDGQAGAVVQEQFVCKYARVPSG